MEIDLKSNEGKSIGKLELPIEEIAREIGQSLSSSSESDARLHEAELKASREKVIELEGELAQTEGKTMDDFSPTEKANFVIAWARGISAEDRAVFARAVGIPMATEAVVSEGEEPSIIEGKTDQEGYRYLENLDLSVREK